MPQSLQKILFAINPSSGGKNKVDWEAGIREYFKDSQHNIETFLLDGANDKTSLQYWIEQLHPDKVVAVGGDGTAKQIAEQLLKTNIALGILPAGSSNGMATELQIPGDNVNAALDIIANGKIKLIDVISLNEDDISLHLSDIGLNADLVKYAKVNQWKGKLGYLRGAVRMLTKKKLMKAEIRMPDRVEKRECFMIVLANAKTYGTGAIINPDGKLNDGLFEVIVVKRISFFELIKMFWKKKGFNAKKVEIFKTPSVDIQINRKMNFQVDGEYCGKINSVSAKLMKQQLNVIVPAATESI
ncbi:MAG: YegS/Rv2252/BmrU family lipid kinase [Parafilimonas sp.]